MGNVYFIRCDDKVKIGFTDGDPGVRLLQLQTGNPEGLALLAVIPNCTMSVEKIYHRALKQHLVRGEWFSYPKLTPLIRNIQAGARPRTAADIATQFELADYLMTEGRLSPGSIYAEVRLARKTSPDWKAERHIYLAKGGHWENAVHHAEKNRRKTAPLDTSH